ncbi:MAG: helix-turn-helix domain-containing protein [Tannerella sp.]|jgi:transcriptional regulator with XRE-family HTH domain|nr:helix-turn-helix domain-containing protein [Tannerella sp.]
MNYIGNNLRKLRDLRKKSQQEVADELEIDRKTYAKWESNDVDVKASYIPKLAEIFGVEISELYNPSANFHIEQRFHNSTINTAILILTEKESINKVLDALKFIK